MVDVLLTFGCFGFTLRFDHGFFMITIIGSKFEFALTVRIAQLTVTMRKKSEKEKIEKLRRENREIDGSNFKGIADNNQLYKSASNPARALRTYEWSLSQTLFNSIVLPLNKSTCG